MEIKVCKQCKKMFQYMVGPVICPRCKQVQEEQFQKVKEYLRENPGATMNTVSAETSVPIKLIQAFLKEGRLEIVPGSPISLSCEKCGAAIPTGRYCNKCKTELVNELSNPAKEITTSHKDEHSDNAKMRFFRTEQL